MSTVAYLCTLFSVRPGVRLLPSMTPAAATTAPFSSQRRSRPLSVCCANNLKGEHNPKTDLHPFNIPPVVLVHPVPPREERWQLKEEPGKVDLWFEVPGRTKEDLAVEIDEDVLVIKKRINKTTTHGAENMDQIRSTAAGGAKQGSRPTAAGKGGVAPADDVIYARLLLPAGYSKEGVEAELKSGVLRVSIAKIKEQARRKINVDIDVK